MKMISDVCDISFDETFSSYFSPFSSLKCDEQSFSSSCSSTPGGGLESFRTRPIKTQDCSNDSLLEEHGNSLQIKKEIDHVMDDSDSGFMSFKQETNIDEDSDSSIEMILDYVIKDPIFQEELHLGSSDVPSHVVPMNEVFYDDKTIIQPINEFIKLQLDFSSDSPPDLNIDPLVELNVDGQFIPPPLRSCDLEFSQSILPSGDDELRTSIKDFLNIDGCMNTDQDEHQDNESKEVFVPLLNDDETKNNFWEGVVLINKRIAPEFVENTVFNDHSTGEVHNKDPYRPFILNNYPDGTAVNRLYEDFSTEEVSCQTYYSDTVNTLDENEKGSQIQDEESMNKPIINEEVSSNSFQNTVDGITLTLMDDNSEVMKYVQLNAEIERSVTQPQEEESMSVDVTTNKVDNICQENGIHGYELYNTKDSCESVSRNENLVRSSITTLLEKSWSESAIPQKNPIKRKRREDYSQNTLFPRRKSQRLRKKPDKMFIYEESEQSWIDFDEYRNKGYCTSPRTSHTQLESRKKELFHILSEPSEKPLHLWQFILDLLLDITKMNIIRWTGREASRTIIIYKQKSLLQYFSNIQDEFILIEPQMVATLWGQRKKKNNMTYEKLSRALRYYYKTNIISKVSGQRYKYKFDFDLKLTLGFSGEQLFQMSNEANMKFVKHFVSSKCY